MGLEQFEYFQMVGNNTPAGAGKHFVGMSGHPRVILAVKLDDTLGAWGNLSDWWKDSNRMDNGKGIKELVHFLKDLGVSIKLSFPEKTESDTAKAETKVNNNSQKPIHGVINIGFDGKEVIIDSNNNRGTIIDHDNNMNLPFSLEQLYKRDLYEGLDR